MKTDNTHSLQIKISFTDQGEAPPLQAYAFTNQGKLIGSAPVQNNAAALALPAELDGRTLEVILGPQPEQGEPAPSAAALKRMGAYVKPARFLAKSPRVEVTIPGIIFPRWCLCLVRGRLVKRFTLPDGTTAERPVCNARVHVCEVDRIPLIIAKLPDPVIVRLRDDLLKRLRLIEWPVPPIPDPGPLAGVNLANVTLTRAVAEVSPVAALSATQQQAVTALAASSSVAQLRVRLVDLSSLILIHLCDLLYLWPYFSVDCLTVVNADAEGRFSALIRHNCADQPDVYLWVEQFQGGAWHQVYRPGIGCGTHWNYVCGTEIVLNLPRAVACEKPTYDVPPGVTLFVLPYSIGYAPIWGTPPGAAPANRELGAKLRIVKQMVQEKNKNRKLGRDS